MRLEFFPPLNACLNTATAVLLIAGYVCVKNKQLFLHKVCMLSATAVSAAFLVCYLYYHAHHGVTRFQGQGLVRKFYFFVLTTHTILAAIQVPLILNTLYRGLRGQIHRHILIAQLTLPIWLYVSITGVVVYWMLYRLS